MMNLGHQSPALQQNYFLRGHLYGLHHSPYHAYGNPWTTGHEHDIIGLQSLLQNSGFSCSQGGWVHINPAAIFTANDDKYLWNSGECKNRHGWFDNRRFMHAPYVTSDGNSLTATVTADVANKNACIF